MDLLLKRSLSITVIGVLSLALTVPAVGAAVAIDPPVYATDFESTVAGSLPGDWTLTGGGAASSATVVDDSGTGASKNLTLVQGGDNPGMTVAHDFAADLTGTVTIEASVKADQGGKKNDFLTAYDASGDKLFGIIFDADWDSGGDQWISVLNDGGWNELVAYTPGQWYDVKVVVDLDGGTYTITVDGAATGTKGTGVPFLTGESGTSLGSIANITEQWVLGTFHIDDVVVTQLVGAAPVASDVAVTGAAIPGQTLTGGYTYSDADGDAESGSTFQWYSAAASNGNGRVAIAGAQATTYEVADADVDQYLFFEVTPHAATGTLDGAAVLSNAVHVVGADGEETLTGDDVLLELNNGETAVAVYRDDVEFDADFSNWTDLPGFAGPGDPAHTFLGGTYGGDSDLSYETHFAYNETTLFLGVRVTDDTHDPAPGGANYEGDGIQFAIAEGGSSIVEFGAAVATDGTDDVTRYAAGSSILPPESIETAFAVDGSTLIYELAIPWGAVRSANVVAGQTVDFTMLVNDRDGAGTTRGYVEWTGGIGASKDPSQFGELQLFGEDEDWTAWIQGDEAVTSGNLGSYVVDILNTGADALDVTLDIPAAGVAGQAISIAPGALFKKSFSLTISESIDIDITVDEAASATTRTDALHVDALLTPSELAAVFDDLEQNVLPALQAKIAEAAAAGIMVDYQKVNAATIANNIPYGREDITHDEVARAGYVAATLQRLADEANAELDSYLDGSATPPQGDIERYVAGQISTEGRSIIGTTTEGADQPIIFSGYGMFEQAVADIPKFGDLGVNLIDFNIAPFELFKKPGLAGWSTFSQKGADFELDTTTSHTGAGSMRITGDVQDHSSILFQVPSLEPETTYVASGWFKMTGDPNAMIFTNVNGWMPSGEFAETADWTYHEFEFTTGSDPVAADNVQVGVFGYGVGTVWVDDYSLVVKDTTVNKMLNPSFEEGASSDWYLLDNTYLDNFVVPALEDAAAHNVGVNLELAPQGWPQWIYDEYPDTHNPDNYGFLAFDIENPRVQEVMLAHIDAIMAKVKDEPALVALNLSNESEYVTNTGPFNVAKWRAHVEELYGTVAELNSEWGTSYGSFAEVPVPDMSAVVANAMYYDYLVYKQGRLTAFHQLLADRVHEWAPELPVHVKFMGYGITNDGLALTGGKDLEATADLSGLTGFDGGPGYGSGPAKFSEYVGMLDQLASMKEQPLFNSENHMISDGEEQYGQSIADWTANWIWAGAMHGTSASSIWVWQRSYAAEQNYLFGSILNRPDAIATVGRTNLDLWRLTDEVTAFQNIDPKVAILSSLTARLYQPGDYYGTLVKAQTALNYDGIATGFVTENQVIAEGALDGYEVIVLPSVTNLMPATLAAIRAWQEDGGTVVLIGDESELISGDEHDQPLPAADRAAVIGSDRTVLIGADPSVADLRTEFFELSADLDLTDVVVYDAATDQPVNEVEWRVANVGGKSLLSLINYSATPKEVYLVVNGTRVDPTGDPLGSSRVDAAGSTFAAAFAIAATGTVQLAANGHALLQIPDVVIEGPIDPTHPLAVTGSTGPGTLWMIATALLLAGGVAVAMTWVARRRRAGGAIS